MGHFCLLKQVLINAFSDSSNAMLATAVVLRISELDEFKSCRNFGTLSGCYALINVMLLGWGGGGSPGIGGAFEL